KLEAYLTVPHGGWNDRILSGRKALTRLRTGSNELRINTGRWEGLAESERECMLCWPISVLESEHHFLLHCSHFQQQRAALFDSINEIVRDVAPDDSAYAQR